MQNLDLRHILARKTPRRFFDGDRVCVLVGQLYDFEVSNVLEREGGDEALDDVDEKVYTRDIQGRD